MNRVLTYGTFDVFHYGHYNLLKRASLLGDLFVGISTDQFNLIKGKHSVHSFEQRSDIIRSLRFVYEAFEEYNWNQKLDDIKRYNITHFVMGDDWKGKFDHLSQYCDVIYLPRTDYISSTIIRNCIHQ